MENKKPPREKYQKVLLALVSVCLMLSFVLILLWTFQVVTFPVFLAFVPQFLGNIFGIIAFWNISRKAAIAMIFSLPTLLVCVIILQCML